MTNPERFLETPDVPGEDGLNTHYSRELVLECIDSALADRAERTDALCDAAYVAGARAGFNAASDGPDALDRLIASRAGYIAALRETRPNPATGAEGSAS